MRLDRLIVKNYRSLLDVNILLRHLNVVIGPNGAGKTALLEIFRMLRHSSELGLADFFERQGGFQAVLSHRRTGVSPDRVEIDLQVDVESDQSSEPMHYELEIAPVQIGYGIAREQLEWQYDPTAAKPFRYIDRHLERLFYSDPDTKGTVPPSWELDYFELALAQVPKMYREPETLRSTLASTRHYSFLDVAGRAVIRLPQSLTPTTRPGPNGENLYSALYNLRASHNDIYEQITSLLLQGFPDFGRLEFPVVGAGQVTLAWYEQGMRNPLYPNQLSEGTLRFLWLVTTLLAQPEPSVMLFDEPEVSLHPELLKLLAALLQDASSRSQIIVATHSPDLIRWLEPEEILIADKTQGATSFTWADQLQLDEWLDDYTLRDLWLMGNLGGRP